jgi:hypothetical protein
MHLKVQAKCFLSQGVFMRGVCLPDDLKSFPPLAWYNGFALGRFCEIKVLSKSPMILISSNCKPAVAVNAASTESSSWTRTRRRDSVWGCTNKILFSMGHTAQLVRANENDVSEAKFDFLRFCWGKRSAVLLVTQYSFFLVVYFRFVFKIGMIK